MTRKPVVGLHDFLNSRPLLHPLRHGLIETPFDLVIDTPANLATLFHAGELDIALIPSIEYARSSQAVIVPDICIASLGRVETVILFSTIAIEEVQTVVADPKSRTSTAMLTILLKELYGRDITPVAGHCDDPDDMLRDADAGLVIGDAAFGIDREKYLVHDLGELWFEFAGRPFVHALLCARKGERHDQAVAALKEAKEIGLDHRDLVAREEKRNNPGYDVLYDYLAHRILYDLHAEEKEGLAHFLSLAKKAGLCQRDDLHYYDPPPSTETIA